MTDNVINLADRSRQRNPRRKPIMINAIWPLIILGCLTFWIWFAFAAVALIPQVSEYLESVLT